MDALQGPLNIRVLARPDRTVHCHAAVRDGARCDRVALAMLAEGPLVLLCFGHASRLQRSRVVVHLAVRVPEAA